MYSILTNQDTHDAITAEFARYKDEKTPRNSRMTFAEELTNAYINYHGYRPPSSVLDRLATLILQDEITDSDVYKVAHNESPILSYTQIDRREKRERKAGVVEYGNDTVIGRKKTFFTDDEGTPQGRNAKVYNILR